MDTPTESNSPLAHFSFPRTGKRGVPQQFPRRLYEMLDSESKQVEASPVISWGATGRAFRIYDVAELSASILPKYFRTKKFSSFQRNLNLYGFTKVRRGPDSDMYAHPSFLRDRPELLLNLRKANNSSRRRIVMAIPPTCQAPPTAHHPSISLRPVSPSASNSSTGSDCQLHQQQQLFHSPVLVDQVVITSIPSWAISNIPKVSPAPPADANATSDTDDRGKLDLLALALETASKV